MYVHIYKVHVLNNELEILELNMIQSSIFIRIEFYHILVPADLYILFFNNKVKIKSRYYDVSHVHDCNDADII